MDDVADESALGGPHQLVEQDPRAPDDAAGEEALHELQRGVRLERKF